MIKETLKDIGDFDNDYFNNQALNRMRYQKATDQAVNYLKMLLDYIKKIGIYECMRVR